MTKKRIASIVLICLITIKTQAQEIFSEGSIVYHITITGKVPSPTNEPTLTETKSGTMTLFVKGDNIRQDIVLEDGYTHSQITNYTTGKEIILKNINNLKYAIEISLPGKNKENTSSKNETITPNNTSEKIAGLAVKSTSVQLKNGQKTTVFFTDKYQLLHPETFEQFSNLKGIPAKYDLLMANGFNTHFELSSLNLSPIQNALFRIPDGYRIISQKEYEKLFK